MQKELIYCSMMYQLVDYSVIGTIMHVAINEGCKQVSCISG